MPSRRISALLAAAALLAFLAGDAFA